MNEEDIIKSSNEYLRRLLLDIGFNHTTKRTLLENEDIASHRWKFLNDIKKYREEGRNILYVDESYFGLDQSKLSECETDNKNLGVLCFSGKGQGLIVVHAGGCDGFLMGALQLIKTLNIRECEINYGVFNKWVKEKLLPNLPEKSIVVMDNAEYHFSEHNPSEIENLLSDNGHELLRIPLFHQDLNPLELIWRDLKQNNKLLRTDIFCYLEDLEKALGTIFSDYTRTKWRSSIEYVKKIESEYFVFNGGFEEIDKMLIDEDTSDDDEIYEED